MTTWVHNRRAAFRYELLDQFEAGIELQGFEVKAIKAGRANLDGAHVLVSLLYQVRTYFQNKVR